MTRDLTRSIDPTGKIFDVANPDADPEGLISKYVAFESARFMRGAHEFDMVGSLQDRLKVLLWYLSDYTNLRDNRFLVPLSARQTAFLNSPAPIAGASAAVTVALFNFVLREKPALGDLRDPDTLLEALYWWCVEAAPRHKLDSRLVTKEQVAVLRKEVQWAGEDFPLNQFMISFFKSRTDLHFLQLDCARDRAALLHYLVLYSFSHPHVARLLPTESVRKVMRETPERASAFERNLSRYVGGEPGDPLAGARKLRVLGADLLAQAGGTADPVHPDNAALLVDSGECCRPGRYATEEVADGVAIIGPIRKTSGLGQAIRMSHKVLKRCERVEPTVLAFDLDNPAPAGPASDSEVAPFRGPRAINLIHLNAESLPLAFAYTPRSLFAKSYNIGYFFWELNRVPACDRLALELVDEVWVSSDFNRDIYARVTEKPVVNVGMAAEPLPDVTPTARAEIGLEDGAFVFLSTFDSFSFIERKNPLGTLEAFRRAFPLGTENVRLLLKTQNRFRVNDPYQQQIWKRIDAAVDADSRIAVINESYTYAALLGLKRACDCYVSLHRSEGWGFGMIEAMQLGLPVIATAYSGNMEFCTDATTFLVGFSLIGVQEREYSYAPRGSVWAEPDLDAAAGLMRLVMGQPSVAAAKAAAARAHVEAQFGLDAIARRYADRLAIVRRTLIH